MMRDSMYNILIVDDEKIEREAIRMIVESSTLPFSLVFEASSGREMLELLKAHHVDIVILDINMPGLTGLQALEMMRADGMDTKVIISTAYDEFNYAVKALQSGAVDFLVKPVSDESLIESLKKSIERLSEERERSEKLSRIEDYLRVRSSSLSLNTEGDFPDAIKQVCAYIDDIKQFCDYIYTKYDK